MIEDGKSDSVAGPAALEDRGIRERILYEATRLFAHKGYAATSVREITQAAGATNPMMYYYFGSKAELYRCIFSENLEDFARVMKALLEGPGSFRERLVELMMFHFKTITENPDMARLFFRTFFGPDEEQHAMHSFREGTKVCDAILEEAIVRAQREGELKAGPWRPMRLMINGMIMNPVFEFLDCEELVLERDVAEALVDIFISGAGNRNEGGA